MKHRHAQHGFTLIEVLIYTGLTAIVVTPIVWFSWTLTNDQIKTQRVLEVENGTEYAMDIVGERLRGSEEATGATVFDLDPGTLVVEDYDNVTTTIDTYLTTVTTGGGPVQVRKLRLQEDGEQPIDLTGDAVTVDSFIVSDVSKGTVTVVQVDLTLSALNPSQSQAYSAQDSARQVFTFRQ